MSTATMQETMTPLQEIESGLHERFADSRPSKKEAGEFLLKQYPQMDGGISIAIALASLALQGWQVYIDRQERVARAKASARGNACPQCGKPPERTTIDGKSVCENGHTW
ncbi:MAG TPA: hypothetical protein VJ862_09980 [Rhodanobacteraceae bacterium]|nr:hypothetical protein [Rhodanobacteraceae bacterium]